MFVFIKTQLRLLAFSVQSQACTLRDARHPRPEEDRLSVAALHHTRSLRDLHPKLDTLNETLSRAMSQYPKPDSSARGPLKKGSTNKSTKLQRTTPHLHSASWKVEHEHAQPHTKIWHNQRPQSTSIKGLMVPMRWYLGYLEG